LRVAGCQFAGVPPRAYVVSTFFRPAGAYFAYLPDRMTSMLRDVKHPRDDLVETLRRLETLTAELDVLNDESAEQDQRLARLEQGLPQAGP
jgi:hypothetical protein